jgi:hypothetical protein
MAIRPTRADPIPHSWAVSNWPAGVYPNRASSGKYTVREHRDELISCGALTRVGRELVVIGAGYAVFLARQAEKVPGYVPSNPPPRRAEAAAADPTRPAKTSEAPRSTEPAQ